MNTTNARDAADIVFTLTGPAHTAEIFFCIEDKGTSGAREIMKKLAPLAIWTDPENDCGELRDTPVVRFALNETIEKHGYTFMDWATGKRALRF